MNDNKGRDSHSSSSNVLYGRNIYIFNHFFNFFCSFLFYHLYFIIHIIVWPKSLFPHLPRDRFWFGCGNRFDPLVRQSRQGEEVAPDHHHRPCITVVYEGEGLAGSPVLPSSWICQVLQGRVSLQSICTIPGSLRPSFLYPRQENFKKRQTVCTRTKPGYHSLFPALQQKKAVGKQVFPSFLAPFKSRPSLPVDGKTKERFFFLFGGGEEDVFKSSHKYQIPECRSLSYFCFIASCKKCEEASKISTEWLYCHYHNLLVDFLPKNGPKTIWRQNQRRTGHGFTISSRFFLSIESSKEETNIGAPQVALQRFHRYENPTIETGRKTTFRINVWSLFQSEGETVGKKWRGR